MVDVVVYGKVIIDSLKISDTVIVRNIIGGGGPQAAFGARVWHPSVGFATRVGYDFDADLRHALEGLPVDQQGVTTFADCVTLRGRPISYDANEYAVPAEPDSEHAIYGPAGWKELLSQPISLPDDYRHPRAIHLVTEYAHEEIVQDALAMRQEGVIFSLEPLIDHRGFTNQDEIVELLKHVDLVTPDWPSASGIAKSDDPAKVLAHWSSLGTPVVAIRNGRHGSYVWNSWTDAAWHVPALPVDVVDPTGGGNAYGGGLVAGWLESRDALKAAVSGTVSASLMIETIGVPAWSDEIPAIARQRREDAMARCTRM
ncbi:MAG: hypothetical protein KC435_02345 [Thermomicrobiales bacterium]|nr:hypothetical protein [Thermomicrobiales bacterium]